MKMKIIVHDSKHYFYSILITNTLPNNFNKRGKSIYTFTGMNKGKIHKHMFHAAREVVDAARELWKTILHTRSKN